MLIVNAIIIDRWFQQVGVFLKPVDQSIPFAVFVLYKAYHLGRFNGLPSILIDLLFVDESQREPSTRVWVMI
jgi:hypothetical protein